MFNTGLGSVRKGTNHSRDPSDAPRSFRRVASSRSQKDSATNCDIVKVNAKRFNNKRRQNERTM